VSKGEILEHKGEGLYRVRQKLAVERIQQELTQVQARLAELAVELPTAKLDLIHADDAVRDKSQEIDALIPDYAAGADGALQQITALQTELIRLQSEASQLRLKVAELIAEDLANRKRQNQLEQVPEGREMDLWCADYSVELTGEVGLVDINDEGGQGTLIQPGFEDGAVYDAARDGALFPNLAQSGPQIYLNAALLPGVQKWRPRYRIGTITKLNGDVCNMDLDPAQSSAQNLSINQAETLQQVPIKYMDCDGLVFEEDDRVLVRFTQSGPLVVGFAENPRACTFSGYAFIPSAPQPFGASVVRRLYWGLPFEDSEGIAINPPLGTLRGSSPTWVIGASDQQKTPQKGLDSMHGCRNWFCSDPAKTLSWHGPQSRVYSTEAYEFAPPFEDEWHEKSMPRNLLYRKLDFIYDAMGRSDGFIYIRGAAITPGGKLVVVLSDGYLDGVKFKFLSGQLQPDLKELAEPLSEIATHECEDRQWMLSDWYFDDTGSQAVCTLFHYYDESNLNKTKIIRLEFDGFGVQAFDAYDSMQVIGQSSGTRTKNSGLSPSVSFTGSSSRSEVLVPIYWDYVGAKLTAAYHAIPARTENSSYSGQINNRRDEYGSVEYVSASYNSGGSMSEASPERIVTSDGFVIAEASVASSSSGSLSYMHPGAASENDSEVLTYLTLISIDLRFLSAVYLEEILEQSKSVSGASAVIGETATLSGSVVYDEKNVIHASVGGAEVYSRELSIFSEVRTTSSLYMENFTFEGSYSNTSDITAGVPSAPWHEIWLGSSEYRLYDCAALDYKGRVAVSILIQHLNYFTDGVEYICAQVMDGVEDPASDFFDRPGETYSMHALTLI